MGLVRLLGVLVLSITVPSPATTQALRATFSDGMYAVGRDIAPGLYHTSGGDSCYWARLDKLSVSDSAIIVNDDISGPLTVQIKATDAGFETRGCGTWAFVRPGTRGRRAAAFGTGMYGVGLDIRPGTYRTLGNDGCYWALLSDLGGKNIVANDNAIGPAVVTIRPSTAGIISKGCGTWKRVADPRPGGNAGGTRFGDGTWRVGVDVKPGTYHTEGGDSCYYETLASFDGTLDAVIQNDLPSGPVDLVLDNTTLGVKSEKCGTWKKVG